MIFKRATDEDIPRIHSLIEMCYRGEFAKKGWTCETDLIDGVRITEEALVEQFKTTGSAFTYHTNEQDEIVGCVYTRAFPDEQKLYVGMLSVHPLFQAKGLGKNLMTATEDIAKEAGCTKLYITVITCRKELIEWYEKMGFTCTGEFFPFEPTDGSIGIPKVLIEFGVWEKIIK